MRPAEGFLERSPHLNIHYSGSDVFVAFWKCGCFCSLNLYVIFSIFLLKVKIQKLADLHGCTFTEKMQPSTTHVIMSTEDDLCPRTMKYMTGVAAQLWIVSYKWVESSLHAGMLLPETNFEVQGDESWGLHSGPFRARTWKTSKPLLSDYSVSLYGKSSILSEDEVIHLLKLCGANSPEAVTSVMLLMDDKCSLDKKEVSNGML
ncbi:Breast cancer type 1 susceptibility protein-like [Holothuria leucospilota]|uniref:Breast cancer type 1 susceptibility protein-like n=1 Tax=Holothuria leucospilota TaxID=206669 RepID=A0A9Q1CKW7_HOLLE|nr:Breast cancer type 1 susceptibility protein-like [Holothuria leucospilota]